MKAIATNGGICSGCLCSLFMASPAIQQKIHPYSRRILLKLATDDAVVPEIWGFEIANIIFVAFNRRKRISQKQIDEYLQLLKALPIQVDRNDIWTNVALESRARTWGVSAYDCAYLDLALRRNLPLATADNDLKKAAASAGVQVLV